MLTQFFIKLFISKENRKTLLLKKRNYSRLGGWVSIFGNLLLFILKVIAGIISGSISLIADAFHTLSDVISSIVVLISTKISSKPEDKNHPFGHGRMDYVGSIIVGLLLSIAAFEFLKGSFHRILHPEKLKINIFIILSLVISIVFKEWMARFSISLSKKINSRLLKVDGFHHRTDAFSSIIVLLGLAGYYLNFKILDGVIGCIISIYIFYTAIKIIIESISEILGKAPGEKDVEQIIQAALRVGGVKGVHDIIIHTYGEKKVISLHIEISNRLTLDEAHRMSERVEMLILNKLGYFATVHIDPVDFFDQRVRLMNEFLKKILPEISAQVKNHHDLRILGSGKRKKVLFDLAVNEQIEEVEKSRIKNKLYISMKKEFPDINRLIIRFEPLFSY